MHAGLIRLHARKHTPALVHARPCTAPLRARVHTHTHTEKYAMLIAFPRQQQFREHVSVLFCTYFACLVIKHVVQRTKSASARMRPSK